MTFMVAMGLAVPVAQAGPGDFASSTDPVTGITTTSVENANGSRTVTRTDANGNVLADENGDARRDNTPPQEADTDWSDDFEQWGDDDWDDPVEADDNADQPEVEEVADTQDTASASGTDPESHVTTTSVANPDGSRTITVTDGDGNVLSEANIMTDSETGVTTTTVENQDGSQTVTQTDADGNLISEQTVAATDTDDADWSDDFEEWGDDDWDDSAEENGDGAPKNEENEDSQDAGAGDFDPFESARVPSDVIEQLDAILAEGEWWLEESTAEEGNGTNEPAQQTEDQDDASQGENSGDGLTPFRPQTEVGRRAQQHALSVGLRSARQAAMRNAVRNPVSRGRPAVQHQPRMRLTITVRPSRRRG